MSAVAVHEWEQLDNGVARCVHCPTTSIRPELPCNRKNSVAEPDNRDTLRREIDAIARQLAGLTERLRRVKTTLNSTTAS